MGGPPPVDLAPCFRAGPFPGYPLHFGAVPRLSVIPAISRVPGKLSGRLTTFRKTCAGFRKARDGKGPTCERRPAAGARRRGPPLGPSAAQSATRTAPAKGRRAIEAIRTTSPVCGACTIMPPPR